MKTSVEAGVVLVGGGHAHLETLTRGAEFARAGVALTLVAPGPLLYSGLATGVLGGHYEPDEDAIDVERLALAGGARFEPGLVTAVDRAAGEVVVDGDRRVRFDVLSIAVGSAVPCDRIPGLVGLGDRLFRAKPIGGLLALREELEGRFSGGGPPPAVVVIGGGPSGCEIAANLVALGEARAAGIDVTLVAATDRLLAGLPRKAGRVVRRSLERRGVRLVLGRDVVRASAEGLRLDDASELPFELVVDAGGLVPRPSVAAWGLGSGLEGALAVDGHLRSTVDERVFGGGDCIAFGPRRLPRVGVFAVRQAPVLADNLLAAATGGALRRFRPQKRWLTILNMGDGTGVAAWGRLVLHGALAFRWKDFLDRRFLARYR